MRVELNVGANFLIKSGRFLKLIVSGIIYFIGVLAYIIGWSKGKHAK